MGDERACFANAVEMEDFVGGAVKAKSIDTIRQLLKRLGLHYPVEVPGQRHLSWRSVLIADFRSQNSREVKTQARRLSEHLEKQKAWRDIRKERLCQNGDSTSINESQNGHSAIPAATQNPRSDLVAPAPSMGGRGAPFTVNSVAEITSLPSPKEAKGVVEQPETAKGSEEKGPSNFAQVKADVAKVLRRLA